MVVSSLLLAFALWIFRSYRELRFAIPIKSDAFVDEWVSEYKLRRHLKILYSDRINTPLSVGIVRPRIILPKTMDINDKRLIKYVLTHECYHIRRFDMLWKLLALCAVCVHWFNPLAWVMLLLFNRDLEITCDEMVLRHFGGDRDGKQSYAYSLIGMAETRGRFSPINSYFSKNAAEERVVSIMKYKKSSVLAILIAVIIVMGLTTAFAASGSDQPLQEVNDVAPHEELYDGNGNLIYSHTADKSINENYLDIEVGNTRFFSETLDCIDGVSGEHVEANAHMAVYTNSGQTWSLKAGQTATLTFDVKPTTNEGNGWSLYLGYVKDGEYEVCSNPRIPSGIITLSLTVPADGEYNFFFTNVSAGSIYVNSCSITIG